MALELNELEALAGRTEEKRESERTGRRWEDSTIINLLRDEIWFCELD
jgi:hypothetical protein